MEPPLSGGVRAREREIKPECQAITDGGDNAHGAPDSCHQRSTTREFKTDLARRAWREVTVRHGSEQLLEAVALERRSSISTLTLRGSVHSSTPRMWRRKMSMC